MRGFRFTGEINVSGNKEFSVVWVEGINILSVAELLGDVVSMDSPS